MSDIVAIWLEFAACVGVIGVAGARLVRYGDALAAITGMSRSWIGMILLATVTSLPELVTGMSAVTVASAPDIAVGDALGSTVFNLALLALAEAVSRHRGLYAAVSRSHVLTAAASIAMLFVILIAVSLGRSGSGWALGHVSLFSLALVAVYGVAMRAIYKIEQRRASSAPAELTNLSLRQALTGYTMAAAFIVMAGVWLPFVGVQLARMMGWSDSLVGTLFIAFATSMPELVTTLVSLRIGAVDLALGNILGSNLFDLLIVALDDIAYLRGPIYPHLSSAHLATAVMAVAMTLVVMAALVRPPRTRLLGSLSWAGVALAALYLVSVLALSTHTP